MASQGGAGAGKLFETGPRRILPAIVMAPSLSLSTSILGIVIMGLMGWFWIMHSKIDSGVIIIIRFCRAEVVENNHIDRSLIPWNRRTANGRWFQLTELCYAQ